MMKTSLALAVLVVGVGGFVFFSSNYRLVQKQGPEVTAEPTQMTAAATPTVAIVPTAAVSPTPEQVSTQQGVAEYLANKYNKPVEDVHVTVNKEVPGFAGGSVMFGTGGPGEGGMWLAVNDNGWKVVWDGNGVVDCNKMRADYNFPDSILKPNYCD